MTRYRIYTEHKNKVAMVEHINSVLEGYSLYYCDGYWGGNREGSLVIEYISDSMGIVSRGKVLDIAHWIKEHNEQQSVLVTQEEVTADFI